MTIPPNKDRIIIYGEAPESDDDDDYEDRTEVRTNSEQSLNDTNISNPCMNDKYPGQSLFSLTPSSSTLTKIFKYHPMQKVVIDSKRDNNIPNSSTLDLTSLSLLHKTLYVKNQQLRLCMEQLHRQPYNKLSNDLHSMSQRLVDVQKTIQNIDSSLVKLKREQKNMDISVLRP